MRPIADIAFEAFEHIGLNPSGDFFALRTQLHESGVMGAAFPLSLAFFLLVLLLVLFFPFWPDPERRLAVGGGRGCGWWGA